ncbi:hypothetical protein EV363DRAFT_1157424 [Boletus edulis]|uniref:C2H2-type domain-containing protein n=1 Tax=Boletus edulis BED1 TaxID=1328754 RepID=A0AAD4BQZ2_BOLED|nr:hypothetical protein EV363DRAFT_1157424 [Boletus edulis]KAF8437977.1 hypothetical protein L210DRAFT_3404696 [Boletus edulis BED1]
MRPQHDTEKLIRTNQYRVPVASSSVPFPSPHSPTNARVGDQKATSPKQPKRSKLHQCEQCKKMFPRPSGLATHMNSHSGAKPYKCIVPNCDKSFAVRSNAKRHLRTHGINPSSPDALSIPRFTVGFEKPLVTQVHDAGRQPSRYRWITQNPPPQEIDWSCQGSSSSAIDGSSRTGLTFQTSMSSATSSTLSNASDDDYEQLRSSSIDVNRYQSDYSRGADEFYPNYGEHTRRG